MPDDDAGYFRKDVLFFSLHNFVGGLQTCNVLLVKKALILNNNKRAVDGVVRSDQLSPGGAGVQKVNPGPGQQQQGQQRSTAEPLSQLCLSIIHPVCGTVLKLELKLHLGYTYGHRKEFREVIDKES